MKLSKQRGEPTAELVRMFMLLAKHASMRLHYTDPMDREDCIAGAIEDLLRHWRKFDETRYDNAFAYYTQIIKNGFVKTWYKLGHKPGDPRILSLSSINDLEGVSYDD